MSTLHLEQAEESEIIKARAKINEIDNKKQ